MWKIIVVVSVVLALALGAAGCAEETTQEAKDQLKQDLTDLKTAVDNLGNLGPDSSIDDIKNAHQDVQAAWDKVVASAADVKEAEIGDVQTARDDLSKAVDDISGDMTPAEAKDSISDEVANLKTAYDELVSRLGF